MRISTNRVRSSCGGGSTADPGLELAEPKGCLFLFLLCTMTVGLIIGADLALRAVSPDSGLWSWMGPGFDGAFHGFHDFGLIWRFALVLAIAGTVASLIIRHVFRIKTKENSYLRCPNCGARSSDAP
jgi:hypothetical protein